MKIKDLYVIPETDMDLQFVEEEIGFLLNLSIYNDKVYSDRNEYKRLVKTRFDFWKSNKLEVGD